MNTFILEKWDMKIIDQLIETSREFIEETAFPVTFNRDKSYERFHETFFRSDGAIIVCLDEDGIVLGGATVFACDDWQNEKFGYLEKIFVRQIGRKRGVGREVVKKASEWFDEHECVFSFATSTANIGATRQFTNLMAKYEYTELGPTLMRMNINGKT